MRKRVISVCVIGVLLCGICKCAQSEEIFPVEESTVGIDHFAEESSESEMVQHEETFEATGKVPDDQEVQQAEDDKGAEPIYVIEPQPIQYDNYEMQAWQTAYAEYINGLGRSRFPKYSLIYVDDDDIPELVVYTGSEASGCSILTFHNGEADVLYTDRLGFKYIERKNLVNNSDGHMGSCYDRIYSIVNGKWVYVTGGEYYESISDSNDIHYYWEDEPVEEDVYEDKLDKVFDKEQAKKPEQYIRLDEMMFQLQMGTPMTETHRYELYVEDVSWDEAQRRCEEKGGYLAAITTMEEYELVNAGIENSGQTQAAYWIGASQDGPYIEDDWYRWREPNREYSKDIFLHNTITEKYWADGEPSYYTRADDEKIDELGIYLLYDDAKENCYLYDAPMDMLIRNPEYTGRIGYICEYDSVTVMSKETRYSADGSIDSWEEYEYDDAGNLTKQTSFNADGSVKHWREYEYDSAKNQAKMTIYDSDGKSSVIWEKEYDSAGNETKCIRYNADDSIDEWDEYEYDSAGNKTKSIGYNADGNVEWRYEHEYDGAGNATKCIRYNADDSIDWWDEYEYDSAGNKTKGTVYNADGSIRSWYEQEYDSEGYETKYIGYDTNGNIVQYYECVNEYDKYYGNIIEKSVYFENGWKDSWHEYEYNAPGDMIRAIHHDSNGETTEVEYDNTGKTIKSFWYGGDFLISGTEWEYDYMGNLTKYTDYRWDEVREWEEYEYILITVEG